MNLPLIFFKVKKNIFKIIFMLKLVNKKVSSKNQNFFSLIFTKKKLWLYQKCLA